MSQSLAQIYLHLVFSTKDREPCLADGWRGELFNVMGRVACDLGCPTSVVGGVADHVHILLRLSRTVAVAHLVNRVKSLSSLWVNQTRGVATPFRWQNGYSVFSVSHSQVGRVSEYIRRQPKHHLTRTFEDELRATLTRHGVEWDERHLWD